MWSKQILMFDSAADECVGGGPAQDIDNCTDKIVNCFNHTRNENDAMLCQLPVVAVHAEITPSNVKPFIASFHQMTHNESPNKN